MHGAISGCTVLGEVHPVSAQHKSLISDTVYGYGPFYVSLHKKVLKGHTTNLKSIQTQIIKSLFYIQICSINLTLGTVKV